jgi:hypothetical protein
MTYAGKKTQSSIRVMENLEFRDTKLSNGGWRDKRLTLQPRFYQDGVPHDSDRPDPDFHLDGSRSGSPRTLKVIPGVN